MNKRTVLVWFRNDLRIQDNEMLSKISDRGDAIIPVYCFDPRYYTQTKYDTKKTGVLRAKFINESVKDLRDSFRKIGGDLVVRHGLPEEIIPEVAAFYKVDEVYHHREVAQEETDISALVEAALWKQKLNLRHFIGHTLYHKEDLPFPIKDIPDAFNVFKKKAERESFIRESFPTPASMTFSPAVDETEIPSLEELGFTQEETKQCERGSFIGGEQEARRRLSLFFNEEVLDSSESTLSPWLSLGCLSVHSFYNALIEQANITVKKGEAIMLGLWWRDYYRFMFKKHGNVFFRSQGFADRPPLFNEQHVELRAWRNGETQNEEVNRIMRRLNETGYIQGPDRVTAAYYLVHHLHVNWLFGAFYFEEKLIDYNPANNYGNWAHVAGVGSSYRHNLKPPVLNL